MKARLVAAPPRGEWLYEVKFDGFRGLALKEGGEVRLLSRNEKDLAAKFPEVTAAIKTVKARSAVIDGEIVALDPGGRSSFQLLQAYEMGQERPPIFFYAFDLLHLNGRNLMGEPVARRKERLHALIPGAGGTIRFSTSLAGPVDRLLKKARDLRLEGLIGKRMDSIYEPGRRSGAWIKLKIVAEQEFVIGGYTNPEGSRAHFGALLVGYHERGKLKFAGKVGTGFNGAMLAKLFGKFEKIPSGACPFANLPEPKGSRYSPGVTVAEMRRCHWVQPRLVCQVKFSEWTRDDKLRQPVFLGLREDKDARDVVRERTP